FAAPIASAAAASPVRCCAWPGAGSATANPAASVQYIRIVGSSHEVISDRVLNREAISQVGSELRRRKTVRARIFSLVTVSHDLLWKQNLAPQPTKQRLSRASCDAIWKKSNRACAVWSGRRILRCDTTTKYRPRGGRRPECRNALRRGRWPAARRAPFRE